MDHAEYTGKYCYMILIDKTIRKVPMARIEIDTPYLTGTVHAQCLTDPLYDLIIGNVPGAREPDDPDQSWELGCATTRSQASRAREKGPLSVFECNSEPSVTKEKLVRWQEEDPTLGKFRRLREVKKRHNQEVSFQLKNDILYRVYVHPKVNAGKPLRQVMVPQRLRNRVMVLAHDSTLGGHLGVKKTTDKILSNFYWPGIKGDVSRFCRSCDICQKTVCKGKVGRVPLQTMPLVDVPFKRVAVDLIGPVHPPSEDGHRYILTLIDFTTRYPEAIPLKNIDTVTVAEALVDMYSRLGVPEEILSDLGTQFVSECMGEVARLLSMRRLTTTPYHPMCNGLVEKFNGTLKTMLRRLCSEQPRQWHRYINALLFAYREVPQESTGFAPFELLYGRSVRGPMHILKELWTKEVDVPEVKTSYQYVFELRERLEETLKIAQEELARSQKKSKLYYDKKAKSRVFKPGDPVLILLPTDQNKLLMYWKGPYKVEEVVGKNDYKVRVGKKLKTYHANLLKLYIDRGLQPHSQAMNDGDDYTLLDAAGTAIIECTDGGDESHEDLLELDYVSAGESVHDIVFGDNLQEHQLSSARLLVSEYSDVFTDVPGSTHIVHHHISLTSDQPVRSRPYTVPYGVRESLNRDLKEMEKMGIIRKSESAYASPVVIVRKKDGSNRICVDYRKLNKVTVFDPEPMSPAQDLFAQIGKDQYFTKIDLSKGYWQIPVSKQDVHKTAFVTPDGTYEFLKMPFGLVNSGATLVRGMRKLLTGMKDVVSYVDDVLVHSRCWEDHIATLRELLERMRRANLTARPSKCVVGAMRVEFVGHQIGQGSIGLNEDNLVKILQAPRPTTKKEVRSFIGLTGYYRDYIPNYATIAAPLTDLTRKGQPTKIVWESSQELAYTALKNMLACKPILKLPDPKREYVLRTDASDIGLGAVLMQSHDGKLFPVGYASKKLSRSEAKFSAIERECFAIIWALRKFKVYLYGTEFTLQTDHQPLHYMDKAKFLNDRIMRWAMFLQNYRCKIQYLKGTDNCGADYLSRVLA